MLISREGYIPSGEGCDDTESTTCAEEGNVWSLRVEVKVGDTEHQKGEVQGEEQEEECDGRSEG